MLLTPSKTFKWVTSERIAAPTNNDTKIEDLYNLMFLGFLPSFQREVFQTPGILHFVQDDACGGNVLNKRN
jgi:hypothetical protein